MFKKFPSCGATQASTQMILDLMAEEGIGADDVERIEITVPPYIYKLVGHPFRVGSNPKVNAQFSIRYCVANALTRAGLETGPLRGGRHQGSRGAAAGREDRGDSRMPHWTPAGTRRWTCAC